MLYGRTDIVHNLALYIMLITYDFHSNACYQTTCANPLQFIDHASELQAVGYYSNNPDIFS